MDALDRVGGAGRDLLKRVDDALVALGAPAGAPIWPLLSRLGVLPGEALEFTMALDRDALRDTAADLRKISVDFAERGEELEGHIGDNVWEGSSAERFRALWAALADHVGDGATADQASLSGRLLALSSYVDGVAEWAGDLRDDVAVTIARALTSTEAVTLKAAPSYRVDDLVSSVAPGADSGSGVAQAAATIGERVLGTVADALTVASDLPARWGPLLRELPFRPPADPGAPAPAPITRLQL